MRADHDLRIGTHEEGMPVGHGTGGGFARQIAVRTGPVLHDHRLAERFAELRCEYARQRVGRTARRVRDEKPDRPRRVLPVCRYKEGNDETG
jgi:hypothetical protein